MKTLQLHKPFRPFHVTQVWGTPNPFYAQFGFTRHNGTDINVFGATGEYGKKWPVYNMSEGFTVQEIRSMPQGGGNEIWLLSDEKLLINGKECFAYIVMAHADKILVPVGHKPKIGELIMIANNTGMSTGPHTHLGLYRCDWDGKKFDFFDKNDANGSSDALLFMSKEFAVDKADLSTLMTNAFRLAKYYTGI